MRRYFIFITIMVSFLLPTAVFAQESTGNAGSATALSIIALVLLVIFAVAVIAAVGLGVIGIGYAMSNSDDG